jgi:hypothetical protein
MGHDRGGGERPASFQHAGLAQAVESWLDLRKICWLLTHCGPDATSAGKGEDRIERETGLDSRMRLVKATEADFVVELRGIEPMAHRDGQALARPP